MATPGVAAYEQRWDQDPRRALRDGKPKPVAFPDPEAAGIDIEGIRCLRLDRLIELKLASGTAPGRRRDLADVQELIRLLSLPADFADRLDPSVRGMYEELWEEV